MNYQTLRRISSQIALDVIYYPGLRIVAGFSKPCCFLCVSIIGWAV